MKEKEFDKRYEEIDKWKRAEDEKIEKQVLRLQQKRDNVWQEYRVKKRKLLKEYRLAGGYK